MRSMTGYGRARAETANHSLALEVEISTVNRKNFDLQLSAPREWNGFDQRVSEWLGASFHRGRAQVSVKAGEQAGRESGLRVDADRMDNALSGLRAYAESRDLPFQPDSRLLLELSRASDDGGGLPDWREIEKILREAILSAAREAVSMREKEGAALAQDLGNRVAALRQLQEMIRDGSAGAANEYRDGLLERLKQLDLELDTTDERVLREVALYADRSDISEELTRLQSHFDQFTDLLGETAPVGRRLDFLCQEIHREFNTIASKTTRIEVTRSVIEAKNLLEQVREQVQNVE